MEAKRLATRKAAHMLTKQQLVEYVNFAHVGEKCVKYYGKDIVK